MSQMEDRDADDLTVTGEMLLQAKSSELLRRLQAPAPSRQFSALATAAAARNSAPRPAIRRPSPAAPQTLAEELKATKQCEEGEEPEEGGALAQVADALGSAKLLKHRDPDVKLLTACCLSDVMRIYAPNTPYDDDALKMIFELFIAQLRGIDNPAGPSFDRYCGLLERLAVVQIFVLMLDLPCADELLVSLFEVLFESVAVDHSSRVESYVTEILSSMLQEMETVTQPVLDAVLVNFLNDKKVEKPAAHALARSLLAKRADELNGCAAPSPPRPAPSPPLPHRRRPPPLTAPPSPSLGAATSSTSSARASSRRRP